MTLESIFAEKGVLRTDLKVGVVSSVRSSGVKVNLAKSGSSSGAYISGSRYGKGEVGELVLIEGQQSIILGKILEVSLPDRERSEVTQDFEGETSLDAIGFVQLLGSINFEQLDVQAGVDSYPRLGDRVFSAPSEFVAALPELINAGIRTDVSPVTIELGTATGGMGSKVSVTPEKLFGRHCAILGSTGGGKSWTTTKIIEECAKYPNAKVILVDPTSEYRSLSDVSVEHHHLGNPLDVAPSGSTEIKIPPEDFNESDFIALFEPSGKVQGPKLREAIKSLRLVHLEPQDFPDGIVRKISQSKACYRSALGKNDNASRVDDPSLPFDVNNLVKQIMQECHWPGNNADAWGGRNDNEIGYCSSLFTRILNVIKSSDFKSVFSDLPAVKTLGEAVDGFISGEKQVFRLCLSDVTYQFGAREIIANVIGRKLMQKARSSAFRDQPVLVVLDEAHNFLGKRVGFEDHAAKLDAFEIIAKEGRKYGLNICLATQRPRDITEGVISQMGTLLVHRLTNDKDRELVERACGEIDRSAAAFLPNLKQGEVVMVGVDFPIPMTIQMDKPLHPPKSDGPSFQAAWSDVPRFLFGA